MHRPGLRAGSGGRGGGPRPRARHAAHPGDRQPGQPDLDEAPAQARLHDRGKDRAAGRNEGAEPLRPDRLGEAAAAWRERLHGAMTTAVGTLPAVRAALTAAFPAAALRRIAAASAGIALPLTPALRVSPGLMLPLALCIPGLLMRRVLDDLELRRLVQRQRALEHALDGAQVVALVR